MKKIALLIVLPLFFFSCNEETETESEAPLTQNSSEGIVLKNNTVVYADSAGQIELCKLKENESVTYKGARVGAADFVRVKLSDGQTGFIRFFQFAMGDEMAVVHGEAPVFERPDASSRKVSFYSTLERVKMVEKKGDWINIWVDKYNKGWIKKSDLFIGQNEFTLAGNYLDIIKENHGQERRKALKELVQDPSIKNLRSLKHIIIEQEISVSADCSNWSSEELAELKDSHKDLYYDDENKQYVFGERQFKSEISELFNYFLIHPRVQENSWMDRNLKSLWYVNITGGAQSITSEINKSDYLGYWNTEQLLKSDKLFARLVLSTDRTGRHIKKQWNTHKELIFAACYLQSYVNNRCDVLVPELIAAYEAIETEAKWDEMSALYVELQDSTAVEGYWLDNELSNIMGYQFWKGAQQPVYGQKAWAHGFWYRRNAEGNAKVIYEILKEINAHYTPLIQGLNRYTEEFEGGC